MKTFYSLKKELICAKNPLLYILFWKINDLIIKLFYILRLDSLDIYLLVIDSILMFFCLFGAFVVAHGVLMGVLLLTYIYYILIYLLKIK